MEAEPVLILFVGMSGHVCFRDFLGVNQVQSHGLNLAGSYRNVPLPLAEDPVGGCAQVIAVIMQFADGEASPGIGVNDVRGIAASRLVGDDRIRDRFIVRADHHAAQDPRAGLGRCHYPLGNDQRCR